MKRLLPILALSLSVGACDKGPPPEPPKEIAAALKPAEISAGTSFRAKFKASSVIPRIPSKKIQKRIGSRRALDNLRSLESKFYAELITAEPEKWRLDFETFAQNVSVAGGEEAISSFDLPDKAFFVEFGEEGVVVTDEVGGEVTDSQTRFVSAVGNLLRERHPWGRLAGSREFARGKIVEAPDDIVLGTMLSELIGPVTESHNTVSFFRFDEDAAKTELAYFDVNSSYKGTDASMKDGEYLDFEAKGRATLRVKDGLLVGYNTSAKITPRASTGAMLPDGSGSWEMSFAVDTTSIQAPQ